MPRPAALAVGVLLVAMASARAAAADPAATTTLVYPPWKHCYGLHRVTQTHLTLRAGFKHRFDNPQGLAALKLAAEDDTTTTRDDDELTVFGVNSGQHMLIYNTSLTAIAFYGREGSGTGEFRDPHGVAAATNGDVVVSDTGNDRLHVLRYAGDALRPVRIIRGDYAGRPLRRPLGVALEGGEVYVCDPDNARVLVLGLDGSLRRELRPLQDGAPFLSEPFAVAALRHDAPFNYFGDDVVVVSDSANARLVQMRPDGTVLAVRRLPDAGPLARRFDWLALDYHANLYVSDRSGRLHKFDRRLQYLLSVGRPGRGEYEFDEPRGLGLYRRFGQIFVAERQGAQYLWTGTDVFSPMLSDIRKLDDVWQGRVRFFLTEYARVEMELVDVDGAVHASVQPPRWTPPGPVQRDVRFTATPGTREVRLRIRAAPTYSSRKYLQVERLSPPVRLPAQDAPRLETR